MNIKSIKLVYFSATGTTKKVVEAIAEAILPGGVEHLDLTPAQAETLSFEELQYELAIIGTPVYNGRVPAEAVQRLRRLKANNTPAVIIVVYGNRAYEDALLELRNIAEETGFRPLAAGAFIGQHSFLPLAEGRPDEKDLAIAREFGEKVRERIKNLERATNIPSLQVPGNFPYPEKPNAREALKAQPLTDETSCTLCGTCASVCPTAAIAIDGRVITNVNACILCCACVANCPTQSRTMDIPDYQQKAEFASKNYAGYKEPEFFM